MKGCLRCLVIAPIADESSRASVRPYRSLRRRSSALSLRGSGLFRRHSSSGVSHRRRHRRQERERAGSLDGAVYGFLDGQAAEEKEEDFLVDGRRRGVVAIMGLFRGRGRAKTDPPRIESGGQRSF